MAIQYLKKIDWWFEKWHKEYLVNFHACSRKSENLHFDRLVLSKVVLSKEYKVLDEKVHKNNVSWHWKVIQRKANSWEIWIFCVMQQTWSSQWKVLLKCRENIWQLSSMKFIFMVNLHAPGLSEKPFHPQGKSFSPS